MSDYIMRLEVAVNDVGRMHVSEGTGELIRDALLVAHRGQAAARAAV
jgi:hypothetical protein